MVAVHKALDGAVLAKVHKKGRVQLVKLKGMFGGNLVFGSLYVPTENEEGGEEKRNEFWEMVHDALEEVGCKERDVLLLGIDNNGETGKNEEEGETRWVSEKCMGKWGVGKRNENGRRLVEECGMNGWAIASTFFSKAEKKKWKHALGKAMISTIKVKSYFGIQGFVGRVAGKDMAKGMQERWVSMVVNLPDAAIEVLARAEQMAPSGCQAVIMCQRLGGKIDTPEGGTESCAYAHRGGGFWLVLQVVTSKVGKHEDPKKAALADAWLTNTCKELEPHVIEKGVGCISPSTTPVAGTRTQGAEEAVMFPPVNVFGDAARVEKLRAIKTKYDPTNVFKAVENGLTGAHNIEPDRV